MWDGKPIFAFQAMYTRKTFSAKKIVIETESSETFTLRISGRNTSQLYCEECGRSEEMIELNVAADIASVSAREILSRLDTGVLHSPESTNGHLLICRGSLERQINHDPRLILNGELWEKANVS